ncbi:pre-rRNA-processing protein TSR1 homolog [Phymastichus coffea]|uniref:pre-rRNA-processing protein TSR1 homolog n=1 Tax=Phymastichus coffea TaxID=108790 RepID=UPI00273CEFAD|nr:pre-rRNA-processing protein TSR1 homolog [Phymastichus coffea]XP_058803989.1 pre-rRNA-processing protein TSR1 homolog [Phymastichus coffea]
MVQETHRPGLFKKPNKPHKTGRHRSKGSISNDARGRISVKKITKHAKKELGKEARRNQLQQIRSNKREEVLKKKRNFGSAQSPPILIAIVALQEDIDINKVIRLLESADDEAIISSSSCARHISLPRFKQRFSIATPPIGNTFATLDLAKVANTILFITSAVHELDKSQRQEVLDCWGEEIIQASISQGLATPIVAITNLESLPVKKRQDHKQYVQKTLFKWLQEDKIMSLDKPADALNILRRAGSQKQRNVIYRNKRSFLFAENVKFNLDENNSTNDFGTLELTGYLQGLPLSVNGLIHIPNFGDYQMSRIEEIKDPFPVTLERTSPGTDVKMDEERKVLAVADSSKQESLESEIIPDPMAQDQTWPTEEEIAEAEKERKIVKRVPKGTSDYQAFWIPDEGEEADDYNDDDDDEEEGMAIDEAKSEVDSDAGGEPAVDDEYETITISETTNEQRYDDKMDLYEEKQALLKLKEAKLDVQFPDEVDTPQDILARDRFQKYRGLDSFRNTPWDKKENLPYDYGRIFQFENFDRTRRRVFREREELSEVQPGSYVTIHINGVSKELFEAYRVVDDQPLLLFGILQYEHKISVLNFLLKRTSNNEEPIKSKERLIFQCGFRRFTACPIFSQHTNGNKHKFERFFQPSSTVVATVFAPITFPPCPILCYLEKENGILELIATGSLLSVNPDRMVIKRVILSGHPLKVHKRSAVIRFMFFNREDIHWFKPVKLRTKYGRKGHIKEPLGTHGHMKCIFDGQLKSQDTVLMNLYKRVYPKWTYEPLLLTNTKKDSGDVNME